MESDVAPRLLLGLKRLWSKLGYLVEPFLDAKLLVLRLRFSMHLHVQADFAELPESLRVREKH